MGDPFTRDGAKKAIQRIWVAGTVGAFFSALVSSIAIHFHEASWTPHWPYTFDLLIRFGYLLFLLVYFFLSNFRIELYHETRDLVYDLIQSPVSLAALVCLDFVAHGKGFDSYLWAITAANSAIIIIAGLALFVFRNRRDVNNPKDPTSCYVKALRWVAVVLAGLSIAVVWTISPAMCALRAVALLEVGLFGVLGGYVYLRWPAT